MSASASDKVVLVDVGVGNRASVLRALDRIGVAAETTDAPRVLAAARRIVLPGVGHFGAAMRRLRARELEAPLREAVAAGATLVGICLGFQMLFEASEEAPEVRGLALLPGRVRRFVTDEPVPHVGWNRVEPARRDGPLGTAAPEGGYFYFVHSYYVEPAEERLVEGWTAYGGVRFCAAASAGRIVGIQFHPEKSQRLGLRVLAALLGR